MASLFDTLELQAFRAGITARTDDSKKWFQANVKKLGQVNRTSLLKDEALDPVTKAVWGNMYMYFYDPKGKDTLLMKTAPKKITDKSKIRARYNLLASSKKYKEFKPCFKHYLTSHVKSKIVRVPMAEWEIAIFLPTEQFKKKGKAAVWADSNKIIRG